MPGSFTLLLRKCLPASGILKFLHKHQGSQVVAGRNRYLFSDQKCQRLVQQYLTNKLLKNNIFIFLKNSMMIRNLQQEYDSIFTCQLRFTTSTRMSQNVLCSIFGHFSRNVSSIQGNSQITSKWLRKAQSRLDFTTDPNFCNLLSFLRKLQVIARRLLSSPLKNGIRKSIRKVLARRREDKMIFN